MPHIMMKLEEE